MTVGISSVDDNARIQVFGKGESNISGKPSKNWSGILPDLGDYRIEVTSSTDAQAKYILEITIH